MFRRERMDRPWCLVVLCVLCWGSFIPPALATHTVEHRFTVRGVVRAGSTFPGTPLVGKEDASRRGPCGCSWEACWWRWGCLV